MLAHQGIHQDAQARHKAFRGIQPQPFQPEIQHLLAIDAAVPMGNPAQGLAGEEHQVVPLGLLGPQVDQKQANGGSQGSGITSRWNRLDQLVQQL